MAEGVSFVDGAKAYASTSDNTLAGVGGRGGNGGGTMDSPIDDFITGGMGNTQPSGSMKDRGGDVMDSPCNY